MWPVAWTARGDGASLFKDRCVRVTLYNTGHPHSHIVLRGRDDREHDLVIAREYISHGVRERAAEIVTLDLGPVPRDQRSALSDVDVDGVWCRRPGSQCRDRPSRRDQVDAGMPRDNQGERARQGTFGRPPRILDRHRQ